MDSFRSALQTNSNGVQAFLSGQDEISFNLLSDSLRCIRESVATMRRQEAENTHASTTPAAASVGGSDHDAVPLFVRKTVAGIQQASQQDFLCVDAIVFSMREMTVAEVLSSAHLFCGAVTFNISLLHHNQGLKFHQASTSSPRAAERSTRWLEKALRLYTMAHTLIFSGENMANDAGNSSEQLPAFPTEQATLTWFLKLVILHNMSQLHRIQRSEDASSRGFQYLAWVTNVAQRDACYRILGAEMYRGVLETAMLYSMAIISASAA